MNNPSLIYIVTEHCHDTPHPSHRAAAAQIVHCLNLKEKYELTMSLGMSYFQTRSKSKWWGHNAIAKSSVAVGRVTGVALSVPGLWVCLGLRLPLVVTEAVREAAVRVGGVASVTTHSLIHSPAHRGGGGPALLSVGHVTFLR